MQITGRVENGTYYGPTKGWVRDSPPVGQVAIEIGGTFAGRANGSAHIVRTALFGATLSRGVHVSHHFDREAFNSLGLEGTYTSRLVGPVDAVRGAIAQMQTDRRFSTIEGQFPM